MHMVPTSSLALDLLGRLRFAPADEWEPILRALRRLDRPGDARDQLLHEALAAVVRALGAVDGYVHTLDGGAGVLRVAAGVGAYRPGVGQHLMAGEDGSGELWRRRRRSQVVARTLASAEGRPPLDLADAQHWVAPLWAGGMVAGALGLRFLPGDAAIAGRLDMLDIAAEALSIVLQPWLLKQAQVQDPVGRAGRAGGWEPEASAQVRPPLDTRVEAAPLGLLLLGSDLVVRVANSHAAQLLGCTVEGLVGERLGDLTAQADGGLHGALPAILAGRVAELDQVTVYLRGDGSAVAIRERARPLLRGDGELELLLTFLSASPAESGELPPASPAPLLRRLEAWLRRLTGSRGSQRALLAIRPVGPPESRPPQALEAITRAIDGQRRAEDLALGVARDAVLLGLATADLVGLELGAHRLSRIAAQAVAGPPAEGREGPGTHPQVQAVIVPIPPAAAEAAVLVETATEGLARLGASAGLLVRWPPTDVVREPTSAEPFAQADANHEAPSTESVTDPSPPSLPPVERQRMEALGVLAGGVAHDFNNNLMVILGYANLVQASLPEGDPLHEDVEHIIRAGERSAHLTQQLLAFTRRDLVHPVIMDVNEAVNALGKMLRRLLGEDIRLAVQLSPGPLPVRMDPGSFDQVLMNLVVNARDAMPRGGRLEVVTRLRHDAEPTQTDASDPPLAEDAATDGAAWVSVAVHDTGVGMSASTRARIFEPFFTTKAPGQGTGLGLATILRILQQVGGTVLVESTPGLGSTFEVLLPRYDAQGDSPALGAAGAQPPGLDQRLRILLLDDEPDVREVLTSTLEVLGHEVLVASNPGEALLLLEKLDLELDLLITDVVMPLMSGVELAARVEWLRPELPVLFVTGFTDDLPAHHGLEPSRHSVLCKPFTIEELRRAVQALGTGGSARTAIVPGTVL